MDLATQLFLGSHQPIAANFNPPLEIQDLDSRSCVNYGTAPNHLSTTFQIGYYPAPWQSLDASAQAAIKRPPRRL